MWNPLVWRWSYRFPQNGAASAARFSEAVGCPWWLQLSWSKTNDLMPGSDLNAPEIGADGRKVASKLLRALHSMLSHFLNNRISHFSTSNSSSGEQISGHSYPIPSTICLTIMRVNGLLAMLIQRSPPQTPRNYRGDLTLP